MSFVTHFGAFTVRGFGGLGAGTSPAGTGQVNIASGASTGYIYDMVLDSDNNLIGIYDDTTRTGGIFVNAGGSLLFKYQQNNTLISWTTTSDSGNLSFIYSIIAGTAGAIYGGGHGGIWTPGADQGGFLSNLTDAGGKYYRTYNSPYSNRVMYNIQQITTDGTYIYGLSIPIDLVGAYDSEIVTTDMSGNVVRFDTQRYIYSGTPSGAYITQISGKYALVSSASGNAFGYNTGTFGAGYYRTITSNSIVTHIVNKGIYCYLAYFDDDVVGIARINASGLTLSLQNNYTYYTTAYDFTTTGLDVNTSTNSIYVSYLATNVTTGEDEDRITKFTIDGNPVWTRRLTQSSGVALGVRKILSSSDGERYYLMTDYHIFDLPADGSVPGTGVYGDYVYGIGDSWVNGSTQLLTLSGGGLGWTSTVADSTTGSWSAFTQSSSTPLLTWNGY